MIGSFHHETDLRTLSGNSRNILRNYKPIGARFIKQLRLFLQGVHDFECGVAKMGRKKNIVGLSEPEKC